MTDEKRPAPTEAVERYRREMLEMAKQALPMSPPTAPEPIQEPEPEQESEPDPAAKGDHWLDEEYPIPDIQVILAGNGEPALTEVQPSEDNTGAENTATEDQPREAAAPPEESPFVGYLRVFVFTAGGAEPLAGARVSVSRQEDGNAVLYANVQTNADGFTPVIPLPSVDPALTMQPETIQPFIAYDIQVSADGFRSAIHENTPVYGNNFVTQPVSLVPLTPGGNNNDPEVFYSGGPADL